MRVFGWRWRSTLHGGTKPVDAFAAHLLPCSTLSSGHDDYPADGVSRDRNSLIRSSSAMLKPS
jgi:hypothetical protein